LMIFAIDEIEEKKKRYYQEINSARMNLFDDHKSP